ncbi:DNA mismatch repair protein MutT [Pelomyxa schiedti]|nr:DNA mismatch repair protein MutT [Pelomyxa schiedti]
MFRDVGGERCVLMGVRRSKKSDGTWQVPGGGLMFGETFEQCAVRETVEETGMHVGNVELVYAFNDIHLEVRKQFIDMYVTADAGTEEPSNPEPTKCDGWMWIPVNKIPRNTFPSIVQFINSKANTFGMRYIE